MTILVKISLPSKYIYIPPNFSKLNGSCMTCVIMCVLCVLSLFCLFSFSFYMYIVIYALLVHYALDCSCMIYVCTNRLSLVCVCP